MSDSRNITTNIIGGLNVRRCKMSIVFSHAVFTYNGVKISIEITLDATDSYTIKTFVSSCDYEYIRGISYIPEVVLECIKHPA